MIKLNELAEILKANENLSVEITENGLLIAEKDEQNESNIPSDLVNFVSIYEKDAITAEAGGFKIVTSNMSAPNMAKLLTSVFGEEYEFSVVSEFEIKATAKKAADMVNVPSYNLESIAHAIDAEGVEIEIHEDGLKVTADDKMSVAEKIDSMNPNLDIQITDEYILVSEA